MRIVRHKKDAGHVLFRYPYISSLSDCDEKVVCLSERSIAIILNALEYSDKMRTRVYTEEDGDLYTTVGDEEWGNFQYYVSTVRTELGSWIVCNEYLERMAVALEGIQESQAFIAQNTYEKVTWQDVINDLQSTLGVGNIIYLAVKEITDLIPSLRVKLDGNKLIGMFWTMMTWNAPILAAVKTIAASQVAQTALMGTAKTATLLGAVLTGFGSLTNYYQGLRDAIFGGWSIMDFIASLLAYLIPDDEGGTGGTDPDNDPTNRTEVNVANTLINNNAFSCQPEINVHTENCCCGGGAGSGAYGPGVNGPADSPPTSLPEAGPPSGFPDIPSYSLYKCKAANTIVLNVAEMFATYADFKNANLSQYTVVSVAQQWIAGKISLAGGFWGGVLESGANWVSDKILAFVWPYPSPLAVTLGVFSEARLLWLDEREENVCGVYNSSSIAEARSFIESAMDGYIDSTSYDAGTKVRAKELYKGLLTNQFLNRLFEKDSFIEGYSDSSSIDCSECGAGLYEVVTGESLTVTNGNPFQVRLAARPGCTNGWQAVVTFTEPFKLTSITDLSGYGKCLANYIYLYPDQNAAGGSIMDTDVVPPPENYLSANAIAVVVTSPTQPVITIGFEWSGEE